MAMDKQKKEENVFGQAVERIVQYINICSQNESMMIITIITA